MEKSKGFLTNILFSFNLSLCSYCFINRYFSRYTEDTEANEPAVTPRTVDNEPVLVSNAPHWSHRVVKDSSVKKPHRTW